MCYTRAGARAIAWVHATVDGGMYFSRSSDMNDYRYSKTASVLDKLVHVIRIFGVFTAIGEIMLLKIFKNRIIYVRIGTQFCQLIRKPCSFSTPPPLCLYVYVIRYL